MDNKKIELAKPEHLERAVNRAKAMLERAKAANAGQYAHGINSTSASVRWQLERIEKDGGCDYKWLQTLHDSVMKLGGYLFSLKENI